MCLVVNSVALKTIGLRQTFSPKNPRQSSGKVSGFSGYSQTQAADVALKAGYPDESIDGNQRE